MWGGGNPTRDTIDFVTIASTGNATDFGNLTVGRRGASAIANSTRSVFAGGFGSPTRVDTIDYVTIQSTGDAADFGNLVAANNNLGTCQSSVRGIIAGGQSPGNTNVIIHYYLNHGKCTRFW